MTRVLLVDDEPLVLIGMQGMLNWAALGYEVVGTARNGAEALRAVQEKQPDHRGFRHPYAGHGRLCACRSLP